jgi:hypothetical protein
MVTIRSVNEIILSLIDFYRLSQPDLDTKPGTVARDLFIDAPASQLALLYDELASVSTKQSLRLVIGSDLDKLAKNFGVIRKQSTPAGGTALFTFSSINAPININKGDIVIASNGFSYNVVRGVAVVPSAINFYRSIASKFREQLDLAGISDQYAVEITVLASSPGSSGNIGKYSLNRTTISGVSNVTNIIPFTGGTDQEGDAAFRNRILASFSGSSVGTALGYQNVALGTEGVSDAVVIEPGDVLMTRDGTDVKTNTDGTKVIISEGSGGKVDVVILGSNLSQATDTFIYRDKSNNNDPTNSKNDVVLGQISGDENKSINRRRIDNLADGVLPTQPVEGILEVTGSVSGTNFIPKSVDSYGRVSGNYELIKDTGAYGGSPFGFDKIHWINDRISLSEDKIKGQFNGQDALTFTDVLNISDVQQNISITNENSTVTFDRSIIKLLHTPATNVTRVFNVNTGERYIVTNQNLDNTGTYNTSGRIKISGNTLPSPSDVLQVDYNWIVSYDCYSDFDGLQNTSNLRTVDDSIDWGYSSNIKEENIWFSLVTGNNFFNGTAIHPVGTVLSAKTFLEVDGTVETVTSGTFVNRLAINLTNLSTATSSIDSVTLKNSTVELYNTSQDNGSFTNVTTVVGIEILYNTTIILPTDTSAEDGDKITVILNSSDVFTTSTSTGSNSGNQITIPSSHIETDATSLVLKVNYISSTQDLFSAAITSLPTSKLGNGFLLSNNNGSSNFSQTNTYKRENQIVQLNGSSQLYVDLNASSTEYTLTADMVLAVIKLSNGNVIWDNYYPGTVTTASSGNYQLIFGGHNSPAAGDRVLVVYSPNDIRRVQSFTYANEIIKTRVDSLTVDPDSGKFSVKLNNLITQTAPLAFSVIEPNTDIILESVTDGYLTANSDNDEAELVSTTDLSTIPDLTSKKIEITSAVSDNNNGLYDIVDYDVSTNTLTISNTLKNISKDQISIIRLLDNQEVWNYSGEIDVENNQILFESSTANLNDKVFVMYYKYKNLRKAPTRLVSTTVDQVINTGTLTVSGTTLFKAENIVFTCTSTGLKINAIEAVRKALGYSSATSIPSTVKLAKILKLEKVTTASVTDDEVLTTLTTYDLNQTKLSNNLFYADEFIADESLTNLEFTLPETSNNKENISSKNLPSLGDKLRITFYYTIDNDSENLVYTRNGTLYTNKKFALINKVYVSSGFKTSQSTRLTISSLMQPGLGSRYKVYYDYLAPKPNERIIITYNYNKLISDVTFSVENTRPINADVLVRAAKTVLLDVTMNVVISDDYKSSSTTVLQNLRDKLSTALTTSQLGDVVDIPTLINAAQSVKGIARARILYFNKTGELGSALTIQTQKDEFFAPNTIIINTETR